MRTAAHIIWLVAWLYLLVLVARLVIGLVLAISRDWRPKGAGAAVAELVYTLTDPPLKAVRKVIRPARLGPIALDPGFIVVMLGVSVIAFIAAKLAAGG
ncbi:MAG: YggT family protein [Bifidobacteriaceae bacterium]|nr:YggT family protein [Bifidobacteriaceae bacterium]